MIESPPIKILDDLAVMSYDASGTPLHEVVRNGLSRIIDVHFEDGQRFWTESDVCSHLNVSRVTARRALTDLADQGRLVRHRSRGTFVRSIGNDKNRADDKDDRKDSLTSIGVFVPYVGSPFWSEVLDEIAAVTGGTGRSLHVYSSHAGESGESIIAQLATSPDNEAIVLLGYSNSATEDLYCRLVERGYRVVTVDSPIRGLPAPFVGVDNDMGIYMGVRHLVELGHRRITLLSYEPPQNVNTQLRANAFLSAAAENDLLEARVFRVDLSVPGGRCVAVAMESIWSDPQSRPTALFCDSAGGAVSALKWCVEQGIAIPKELSILSFDNTRQVQFSRPTMSCIAQPLRQIAHVVMELVERPQIRHILLPPTLVVRNSTASLH